MTKSVTHLARSLRRRETEAEHRLWRHLRDRRLGGHTFVRQWPIGPYVADFACRDARLVVERDGSQHADDPRDVTRDAILVSAGFAVLRFWNPEVFTAIDSVCETIVAALEGRLEAYDRYSRPSSALSGTFSPEGRRESPGEPLHHAEHVPSPHRGEGAQSGG